MYIQDVYKKGLNISYNGFLYPFFVTDDGDVVCPLTCVFSRLDDSVKVKMSHLAKEWFLSSSG